MGDEIENVHFWSHGANNLLTTRLDGLPRGGLGQGFTKHIKAANTLAWSALTRGLARVRDFRI